MENTISDDTSRQHSVSYGGKENNAVINDDSKNDCTYDDGHSYSCSYSLKLDMVKKAYMSEIVNIGIESNEEVAIMKVCYANNSGNAFIWEIFKTVKAIRELLIVLKNELEAIHSENGTDEKILISRLDTLIMLTIEDFNANLVSIIKFLNEILTFTTLKTNIAFLEFLEISKHSFSYCNENSKPKEGYLLKKTDPYTCRCLFSCISFCFPCCAKKFNRRWFMLKDDMICYLDNSVSEIGKDIFWFDQDIQLELNYKGFKNTICLISLSRKLILKFPDEFEKNIWCKILSQKILQYKSKVNNIYQSFSNEKDQCNARWFVDAESYFQDVYLKLLGARETIFMAGWWISPEIFFQRPVKIDEYQNTTEMKISSKLNRLMDILKYKAEQNVKIYLLLYKEPSLALTINSSYSKKKFSKIHKNIKVTRHPKKNFEMMWSHHEKIVVIDQKFGYIGGIDLCWGRYDTLQHQLCEMTNLDHAYLFPGKDYSNPRIRDFANVQNYLGEMVDRENECRMPWHDVQILLEGPAVSDLSRHFVEMWNYSRIIDRKKDYTITNVISRTSASSLTSDTGQTYQTPLLSEEVQTERQSMEQLSDERKMKYTYNYPTSEDEISPIEEIDFSKRKTQGNHHTRHHKDSLYKTEKDNAWRRQRRKTSSLSNVISNKRKESKIGFMDTLRGVLRNFKERIQVKSKIVKNSMYQKFTFRKGSEMSSDGSLLNMNISGNRFKLYNESTMTCQLVRSAANWSVGLDKKDESSILRAYCECIEKAEHYIYIENQFFISKSFTSEEHEESGQQTSSLIINEIALKIRQRIERAYRENKKFRVFIFLPLLPAFSGDVDDSATLQIILRYTYKTISRNKGLSLIEKLYQLMDDKYEDYIFFFSLRTHAMINDIPITELIYIHSKMMIIDDQICIIGSANINDRSMTGNRDSEIAVIVKENVKIKSIMDGQWYLASEFVRSLRIRLMKEHCGCFHGGNAIDEKIFIDPLNDELFNKMKSTAKENTRIYRYIFNCYPDDNFAQFEDIPIAPNYATSDVKARYLEKKNFIIGNLVEFPLEFLKEENLKRAYFCKERLVPLKNFV